MLCHKYYLPAISVQGSSVHGLAVNKAAVNAKWITALSKCIFPKLYVRYSVLEEGKKDFWLLPLSELIGDRGPAFPPLDPIPNQYHPCVCV